MRESKLKVKFIHLVLVALFGFGVHLNLEPKIKTAEKPDILVDFIDVGQGDSTLIKTDSGKYVLVDGGPDKSILNALGKEIPEQRKEIEAIIVSHVHADHFAGFIHLLDYYKVNRVYMAKTSYFTSDLDAFYEAIKKHKVTTEEILPKKDIWIDETLFRFHQVLEKDETINDVNDESLVLQVSKKDCDYLFLGDLSAKYQERILFGESEKIEVLKVSHHGSKDAFSEIFNERLKANYAIISVGIKNIYGHPHELVIQNHAKHSKVLRTDLSGTVKTSCRSGRVTLDN